VLLEATPQLWVPAAADLGIALVELPGFEDVGEPGFVTLHGDDLVHDAGLHEPHLHRVAEVCQRDYRARPARNWQDVRDQLLLIAIEWDLAHDRLHQQSDSCLRAIAAFLQ
jgi:hypothetical protein